MTAYGAVIQNANTNTNTNADIKADINTETVANQAPIQTGCKVGNSMEKVAVTADGAVIQNTNTDVKADRNTETVANHHYKHDASWVIP